MDVQEQRRLTDVLHYRCIVLKDRGHTKLWCFVRFTETSLKELKENFVMSNELLTYSNMKCTKTKVEQCFMLEIKHAKAIIESRAASYYSGKCVSMCVCVLTILNRCRNWSSPKRT